MGVRAERTIEVTFLLPLLVRRIVLQLPSLIAHSSSLFIALLGLLVTQAWMVPTKGTPTLKLVKVFDAWLLEHCI